MSAVAGNGGNGGGPGQHGSQGGNGDAPGLFSPGSGGTAGRYIVGNSNVTWVAVGTRGGGVA